jgi:CO/xanthine dehydrogenase Mo-binding subunit
MTYKIVGESCPRLESREKALGQAKYTDDYVLPNMVYGKILRSPYAHAKVKSVDKSQAEKVPGVLKILLPEDVPNKLYNCTGAPPSPLLIEDEKILTDHPLYMGDRIAAVAAVTEEACEEALNKLVVEYEELEPIFDVKEALREDAVLLNPEVHKSNMIKKIEAEQGDVEKGFAESDYVFEDVVYTPAIQNISMEPNSCICDYTADGKLTIISTSQTPFQERRVLAKLLGMKENDIRIIKPTMGGGFGERQQFHNQPVGALLSKAIGRPVKIINTREEQMYASTVRHGTEIYIKVGVTKDGYIKALKLECYFNTGAYTTHGPTVMASGSRKTIYNIPHYSYEGYCVLTNTTPGGAVRGYGNTQTTFAREVMLDRIAKKLNMDPIELKMKNHVKVGDTMPAAGSPR